MPADKPGSPKRVTLDRLLSKLGVASRAQAAEWIGQGRVSVNGRVVRQVEHWVSWPMDRVTVDRRTLEEAPKRFFLFHKPRGVVTTRSDENGRRTIFDVLPEALQKLHAVGRLDQATSGLLLLTNDTALSDHLTDPTTGLPRTYLVTVRGLFTEEKAIAAVRGILDKSEHLQSDRVSIQKATARESHLEVILRQGKNREVRRLMAALGHEVTRLRRIQFGPFHLRTLEPSGLLEIPIEEARRLSGLGSSPR